MTDPYPILEVEQKGIGTLEEMGSKSKFWHTHPDDDDYWLFKYPRSNTGEHWAEKVAAEIADQIGIPHANVELAVFQGTKEVMLPRFCGRLTIWDSGGFLEPPFVVYG